MKTAIIGSGISGLSAAATLHERGHAITVYEESRHIGGHVKTVEVPIDGEDKPCLVELGVFMHDPRLIHPLMNKKVKALDIKIKSFPLSISFTNADYDFSWTTRSKFNGIFRDLDLLQKTIRSSIRQGTVKQNLSLLTELSRFFQKLPAICSLKRYRQMNLEEFCSEEKLSKQFIESWLLPQTLCWWGITRKKAMASSAVVLLDSFNLVAQTPQYIFTDGWQAFTRSIFTPFQDKIHTECRVNQICRGTNGVEIKTDHGSETYDNVILATPPSIADELIQDKSQEEKQILRSFDTATTTVYLHRDTSWMPERDKWSIVNLIQDERGSLSTLWSGGLDERKPDLFVSWSDDPNCKPDPTKIMETDRWHRTLPQGDYINASININSLQGENGLWYCGAHVDALGANDGSTIPSLWHENAYRSGLAVAHAVDQSQPK